MFDDAEDVRQDGYIAALEDVIERLEEQVEELSMKGSDGQGMVEAVESVQEMLNDANRRQRNV